MNQGTIIFLNGTTSAGKTSTLHMLQNIMIEPYLEVGIDKFLWMLPRRYFHKPLWDDVLGKANQTGEMGHKLIHAMHHTILTLSNQGIDVLADHVLIDQLWLEELVCMFHDKTAYLIGIKCPLDVLEQRELARHKERTPGAAIKQLDIIHAHDVYDFEVDTSKQDIEDTAMLIKDFLDTRQPPRALHQLFLAMNPG